MTRRLAVKVRWNEMATFLLDCEVTAMELALPSTHRQALLGFFDGSKGRDRAGTRALVQGDEIWLESEGGRVVLVERGSQLVLRELEIFEDRGGEFFGRVVVNLFVTYRGTLRCRLKWDAPGVGDASPPLEVEAAGGTSNWKGEFTRSAWLPEDALVPVEEEEEYVEELTGELPDDVRAKLDEARRHFEEYKRLKGQREEAKE